MRALRFASTACAALALSACATANETMALMGLQAPQGRTAAPAGPGGAARAPAQLQQADWGASNFQPWSPGTPDYLLYPGDELSIIVPSAPELSRDVTIGPDGRFSFPYVGLVMAANRSALDVAGSLSNALSSELLRPYVEVAPSAFGSQKILVLGEVGQPGMYDLPGPMGALEAVAMAGGFTDTANPGDVSIIRRAASGAPMRREVDLGSTLRGRNGADYDVLARYDIVYVPRSGVAEANRFIEQYIRNMIPFNIGFSYAVGDAYASASVP